jgi:pSer/pThr/pTyr-binding forkhead associated (FHA) protein
VLQLNEGTVTVHDLGSANGTFINGNRLTGKELTSQDTVTIGGTKMVFIAASSTDSLAA